MYALYKVEVQNGASGPLQEYAVAQEVGLQFLSVLKQKRYLDDVIMPHLEFYSQKYSAEFRY